VPLYEYRCRKCGHTFEKIESVGASDRKKCPKCRARAARVHSAPAIQFKGSGWYVTDYSSKSSDAESKKAETANTDTNKTPAAKESTPAKDTKPAKKEKQ
jgi:putative FmdB family regulatory protein